MGYVPCEPLATTIFFFINWSIRNLVLGIFLFKATWLNKYYWFINIDHKANSTVTRDWEKHPATVFSVRHTTDFSCLDITASTSELLLGAILNREVTTPKKKSIKMCHQIDYEKDICLHHNSSNKKTEHVLVWPQLGLHQGNSKFLLLCTGPWMTTEATQYRVLGYK